MNSRHPNPIIKSFPGEPFWKNYVFFHFSLKTIFNQVGFRDVDSGKIPEDSPMMCNVSWRNPEKRLPWRSAFRNHPQ